MRLQRKSGQPRRQPLPRRFSPSSRSAPFCPPFPDEKIAAANNNIIGPSICGAKTYGDFMVDRQTLSYIRLASNHRRTRRRTPVGRVVG